ncbi:MAG TPA: YMGG-like glycine zipper-containing protein [Geminicoccaceae bacterium]|nr:YMGG-like glycine zipper-containing protein [Geminicoccaceae bacterium]
MTAHLRPIEFWRGPAGALILIAAIWLGLSGVLGGCTMDTTEQRTFSGAGIGAAVGAAGGALFGAFAGVPGTGAAIGAAAGAAIGGAGGYIVDQVDQRKTAQAETSQLRQENEQLRQQQQQQQQSTPPSSTAN